MYNLSSNQVLLVSQVWHRQELFINPSAFYTTLLFYCMSMLADCVRQTQKGDREAQGVTRYWVAIVCHPWRGSGVGYFYVVTMKSYLAPLRLCSLLMIPSPPSLAVNSHFYSPHPSPLPKVAIIMTGPSVHLTFRNSSPELYRGFEKHCFPRDTLLTN